MKTILRNLFYTLKRFRTASVLNLLGLSTAFAAFMLIMMKASYEYNFDTCYPDSDRLVMLNFGEEKDNSITLLPRGPIDFLIQQVPGIEYGTIYAPCWQKQAFCTNPENPQYFYETPWAVYPDFGKVIGLQFVKGSDKDMDKPESIIISESYAHKLFPKGNALGSYLYTEGNTGLVAGIDKFRICGIFKDLPENCQFKNDIFIRMSDFQKDDCGSMNFFAFFRLKPGVSATDINSQIEASGANKRLNIVDKGNQRLYVFPIQKLYYDMSASYYLKTGNRNTMILLVSIGLLIIIIACINLINFSTALAPVRMRSINTQKVLGSPVNQLRIGLISETIAIVLIGWLLSLFIVWILTHMKLLSLIGFTPSFFTYLPVILISGGIALLTGIIAGLYPAWYMTSFPPALMLKGNYALSAKGRLFRTLLTSFQYIISFALLVCATFIWQQNQYMKIQDTGFARDEIVIAGLPHKGQELSQFTTFKHELEKFPEFKGTAYVSTKLGASDVYSMTGSKYEGEEFYHYEIRVSPDFGEVMGFKLLEGRFFLASDTISSNKYTYCLGTKRIKDEQHIPTDTPFRGNHSKSNYIVGYIDDVIFTSSRVNAFAYSPFLFTVESQLTKLPYAYIRIKAGSDVSTALRHIHETAEKIFPGYPVEVNFFNTYYQQLYEKETNQQYMVTLFSLLAIIISLVGVFGLTIFETAYRRKEIGIRKVYGAKTSDILWNFNRTYLRIITICSIIASPFAWFFMDKWLQNFIIRINLSPWVFLIAFAIIIILTLTIVTIQNYRAATSNPTENLKIE